MSFFDSRPPEGDFLVSGPSVSSDGTPHLDEVPSYVSQGTVLFLVSLLHFRVLGKDSTILFKGFYQLIVLCLCFCFLSFVVSVQCVLSRGIRPLCLLFVLIVM